MTSNEDKLDAYGHLIWTVGTKEERPEDDLGGEWMACFDAVYNEVTNTIDYEVVVDGDTFVDTPERGSIPAWEKDKVTGLKDLPDYWHSIGLEQGLPMDNDQLAETRASWEKHIDGLLTKGITPEDEEATLEQSPDYFNHFIGGDR